MRWTFHHNSHHGSGYVAGGWSPTTTQKQFSAVTTAALFFLLPLAFCISHDCWQVYSWGELAYLPRHLTPHIPNKLGHQFAKLSRSISHLGEWQRLNQNPFLITQQLCNSQGKLIEKSSPNWSPAYFRLIQMSSRFPNPWQFCHVAFWCKLFELQIFVSARTRVCLYVCEFLCVSLCVCMHVYGCVSLTTARYHIVDEDR